MFCCRKSLSFNKKVVKKKIMKSPVVRNDNEGVESAEDSDTEPHVNFEPGVIYESVAARDAREEAEKSGQPIVKDAKYAIHPKMSRRQTLTDLLTTDKAKADKSVNVDMADAATIDIILMFRPYLKLKCEFYLQPKLRMRSRKAKYKL